MKEESHIGKDESLQTLVVDIQGDQALPIAIAAATSLSTSNSLHWEKFEQSPIRMTLPFRRSRLNIEQSQLSAQQQPQPQPQLSADMDKTHSHSSNLTNPSCITRRDHCHHQANEVTSSASASASASAFSLLFLCCSFTGEFLPKFILEVLGGTGAIWGFSEAIGWRRESTVWFWRPAALTVGFFFWIRFVRQFAKAWKDYPRQHLPSTTSSMDIQQPISTQLQTCPTSPTTNHDGGFDRNGCDHDHNRDRDRNRDLSSLPSFHDLELLPSSPSSPMRTPKPFFHSTTMKKTTRKRSRTTMPFSVISPASPPGLELVSSACSTDELLPQQERKHGQEQEQEHEDEDEHQHQHNGIGGGGGGGPTTMAIAIATEVDTAIETPISSTNTTIYPLSPNERTALTSTTQNEPIDSTV